MVVTAARHPFLVLLLLMLEEEGAEMEPALMEERAAQAVGEMVEAHLLLLLPVLRILEVAVAVVHGQALI
jgi:hypothetical protein